MKKIIIIFFLIFIYIIIINKKVESAFIEKIDLNLKSKEMGITFINLDNSKSLLINKDNVEILIVLYYINDRQLEKTLRVFGIDQLDYLFMNDEYDLNLDTNNKKNINNNKIIIEGIKFVGTNNLLQINYFNHNFCVYKKPNMINTNNQCNYLYFIDIDETIMVNDNVNIVFYNEGIEHNFLEPILDKWIDIYMLKKDNYFTLKLDKDNYNTITFPLKN